MAGCFSIHRLTQSGMGQVLELSSWLLQHLVSPSGGKHWRKQRELKPKEPGESESSPSHQFPGLYRRSGLKTILSLIGWGWAGDSALPQHFQPVFPLAPAATSPGDAVSILRAKSAACVVRSITCYNQGLGAQKIPISSPFLGVSIITPEESSTQPQRPCLG